MAFSVNTNIASLQAQNYLRANSDFQSKTINRVTSGLRIVSSGDDAAGLAIANGFRSDQAGLTQGIRNANDGLSSLQTIDGGINNISQLLDRARTLATQSASGTFNGDRAVLADEFQSVIVEINRQAQAIGLDTGGMFAKSLSVFIGGGKESGTTAIENGSSTLDLSRSTVDAKSLGLQGVQAVGVSGTDIGTGSATTSVAKILAHATNQGSQANSGYTDFFFQGPGFSDTTGSSRVKVSVNLSGVTDTGTLAAAINSAIESAGNGTSQQATAFKNAGIEASIVTATDGKQRLAFSSSSAAFQVVAGDRVANAVMGNFSSAEIGNSASASVTGGAAITASTTGTIKVRIDGLGLSGAGRDFTVALVNTTHTNRDLVVAQVNAGIQANATLAATGLTASLSGDNKLVFTGPAGESFSVSTAGDTANLLGFGTFQAKAGAFDYTNLQGAVGTFAAGTQTLEFSINGGATVALAGVATGGDLETATINLNTAIQSNATLRTAGMVAENDGTQITLRSNNGDNFRVNVSVSSAVADLFGFGTGASAVASSGSSAANYAAESTYNSGGSANTALGTNNDVFTFAGIRIGGVSQTLTISGTDSAGAQQALALTLTGANASTLDAAVTSINEQLQQSNNATLRQIVAVKELNHAGTGEGVRFLSNVSKFSISIGTTGVGTGVAGAIVGLSDATATAKQGALLTSETAAGGSVADISTQENASAAVTKLAEAVSTLGKAQAVVGKGQNSFNYAINLAQSQLTNLSAAESRIRDADLAAEAANLTKAQILMQAGTAALAQANSAPQAILALLRG